MTEVEELKIKLLDASLSMRAVLSVARAYSGHAPEGDTGYTVELVKAMGDIERELEMAINAMQPAKPKTTPSEGHDDWYGESIKEMRGWPKGAIRGY